MFTLKSIVPILKKLGFYLSGAAVLAFLFKVADGYLKSRAVKRSDIQGQNDEKAHASKVESAEKDWIEKGKKTDLID